MSANRWQTQLIREPGCQVRRRPSRAQQGRSGSQQGALGAGRLVFRMEASWQGIPELEEGIDSSPGAWSFSPFRPHTLTPGPVSPQTGGQGPGLSVLPDSHRGTVGAGPADE